MYTSFFGLNEKPFSITPDPHFLYLSERHGEALAHLLYGVTESGGFIQLTGEVGTGKTTLTRSLLERLPGTVDLAVVLNPRLSVREFLLTIFDELHLDIPQGGGGGDNVKILVDTLNQHLLESHRQGRRTVLLVDEAQNLDAEVLEQVRLLTNLETSKQKLLQIILVGQPELRTTLARKDLRQLAQRITGRYHLQKLSADETIGYIEHRLRVAGAQTQIFVPPALWEVYRRSGGVPRLINVICDRALLGAYTRESPTVSRQVVIDAALEVSGEPPATRIAVPPTAKKAALVAAIAIAALAGLVGISRAPGWLAGPGPEPAAATGNDTLTPAGPGLIDPATAAGTDNPGRTSGRTLAGLSLARRLSLPVEANDPPAPQRAQLNSLLASSTLDSGTDTAFRSLFGLWDIALAPDGAAPCLQADRLGMKCEFQTGSWRLVRSMNRPAILSLVDAGGGLHHAVLAASRENDVTLLFGNDRVQVSVADLQDHWDGEYLLLWRPHPKADRLMLPGYRGEGVEWLRATLAQLNGESPSVTSTDLYDDGLQARVRRFQRDRRLEADGKAGIQTLIALNSALDLPGTPYLDTGR